MTKKKTNEVKETAEKPKQYVVLTRIHYRSMEPEHRRYIDPFVNPETGQLDPYHPDAPRVTLEHLSPAEVKLVLIRKVLAEDKEQ